MDDEVRQLIIHPKVWPHLIAWLAEHGIEVVHNQFDPDDIPTYTMSVRAD